MFLSPTEYRILKPACVAERSDLNFTYREFPVDTTSAGTLLPQYTPNMRALALGPS